MPKRTNSNYLASARKRSKYQNVTTRNLRALMPTVETKYKDFNVTTSSATSFSPVVNTSNITNGSDRDQRIGNRVTLKGLDLTIRYRIAGRLSILIPKDPSVVPTILDSTARYDHANFTILHDEVLNVSDLGELSGGHQHKRVKLSLNMERLYNISGIITKNNIYIVYNTSVAQSSGDSECTARLYYQG